MTTPQHPPENDDTAPDLEDKLRQMFEITGLIKELDETRLELKEEILPMLNGSRYFVGQDGQKYYGYRVTPEPIDVDLDLLDELVDPQIVSEIVDRKVNKAAFKKAVETKRISTEVFVKVAKKRRQDPHIRFGDPRTTPNFAG